jgi:hypothetical protein
MTKALAFLIFLLNLSIVTKAQDIQPKILKEPAGWEFEKFGLPPSFAPGISYKGTEELRFAPGMFKKDSADYFAYAFVAAIDTVTAIGEREIKDYLIKYYKGLCASVASDRKLTVDTSQITATVEKKKDAKAAEKMYNASVNLFGVFTDGAPVKLNMEINVITNVAAKKTYLLLSPLRVTKKNLSGNNCMKFEKRP